MPGARLPMRKIRDVLRLTAAGMSSRKIAAEPVDRRQRRSWMPAACAGGRVSLAAARGHDRRGAGGAAVSGLDGAGRDQGAAPAARLADDPSRAEAAGRDAAAALGGAPRRAPHGYGYSRFCELYRAWEARLSPTMRQTHVAGERLFVDYAGTTLEVIDGVTGEVMTRPAVRRRARGLQLHLCRGDLDAGAPDWIGSHTRAFAFIGGVTAMVVSDNLQVGHHQGVLLRAGGEPQLRRDGGPLRHGHRAGAAQEAARQGQGRGGVLLATRWIIAKLRNRKFFSLPS